MSGIAVIIERVARALGIPEQQARNLMLRSAPVLLVGDITRPEDSDVFNERLCIGNRVQVQQAGQYAHIQLYNPPGSGVIATCDLASVANLNTASRIDLRVYDTALSTAALAANHAFRDRRIAGEPACQIRYQDNAATLGESVRSFSTGAADSKPVAVDFILQPGQGILFGGASTNNGLESVFWWTERQQGP